METNPMDLHAWARERVKRHKAVRAEDDKRANRRQQAKWITPICVLLAFLIWRWVATR